MLLRNLSLFFLCLFGSAACTAQPPKYEFRAAWFVTLANIDWPSDRELSPAQERAEFIALLDRLQANGLNAVVVQVRPNGDAFYPSRYAPWSFYLTGEQGRPPEPYYDPLAFMIEAAHARQMEFHAWFNPYRVVSHTRFNLLAPTHIYEQHPDWCITYGKQRYLDPGLPQVRHHLTAVVMEVARNYDLDGIHFDDYFYPYLEAGIAFGDEATYQRYGRAFRDRGDWRRANVDAFIQGLSDSLRACKPHLKFGISPIGIWRNKKDDPLGSNSRVAQTAYDVLHADVRKWLQLGWIDYVAPQLYWSTRNPYANYQELLNWWEDNSFERHLYIGQAMFKVKEDQSRWWSNPTELRYQLALNRHRPRVQGALFYSAKSFIGNPHGIETHLQRETYRYQALPPPMPWKDSVVPRQPERLTQRRDFQGQVLLTWQPPTLAADGERPHRYAVYRFDPRDQARLSDPRYLLGTTLEPFFRDARAHPGQDYLYVVTSLDRLNNESEAVAAILSRAGESR